MAEPPSQPATLSKTAAVARNLKVFFIILIPLAVLWNTGCTLARKEAIRGLERNVRGG